MAITGLGFSCRSPFPFRRPSHVYSIRKIRRNSVAAVETLAEPDRLFKEEGHKLAISNGRDNNDDIKALDWKKLSSKELGISTSMIAKPTRVVLNVLKKKGYEVYLVGGCVRDLILKRIPKDFDIITTAELYEVLKTFSQSNYRSQIVGRRFPICHVEVDYTIVEVSSFSTSARKSRTNSTNVAERPYDCNEHDYRRWKNCLRRDFTINGLMFDPYANVIYDYVGGMQDLKKAKVRTVISAQTSFQEDCARILRAVRIAARLGFRFTKETANSVKNLSSSVLRLEKGRLLMEMNYMLAFGSAEASLRLLWKIGLLEILLPIQAAYFVSQGFRRRDERSNMLLSLFSNLDKLLAPDKPCHASLWLALLAFHQALVDHPKDHMVVAAFSLAVYNGGDLFEAVNIARVISNTHDCSLCELEPQELESDETLVDEVMDLAASVETVLTMMMDESFISRAMAAYPQAPYSDLVFISWTLNARVRQIFECVRGGKQKRFASKKGKGINYENLVMGNLQEVRYAFARIVFDTVYPPNLNRKRNS